MGRVPSAPGVDCPYGPHPTSAEARLCPYLRCTTVTGRVATAVEAAHQRIHRNLGTECGQVVFGEVRPNIGCTELDCAYAALDVDDPSLIEMPWRSAMPDQSGRVPSWPDNCTCDDNEALLRDGHRSDCPYLDGPDVSSPARTDS